MPLEPAALALVKRPSRQVGADLAHGERAQLGGRAFVQLAPAGLEAVAQQVVGAAARYERDVEGVSRLRSWVRRSSRRGSGGYGVVDVAIGGFRVRRAVRVRP